MARTQAPIFVLRSWLDDQTMKSQSLMVMTPLGGFFTWINTLICVEFHRKNNWAFCFSYAGHDNTLVSDVPASYPVPFLGSIKASDRD